MIFYCALSIGRVFSATIKTCPNVHQVHHVVLTIEMSINMQNNEQTEYKTVRGLTRGLMLLNMLNKLDGGASVGLLAELSGLHRTTVRRLLETLQEEGYVRRSPSDDSFRLTIKVRQLSEGFRDEQWISALTAPLLGDLLREVVATRQMCPRWMLMQWWYAKPLTVSAAYPFTGQWSGDVCRF